MCVAAGGLVARTVGDTLFLTRFGSERLPLMYISTAALVAIIAFAYSSGFGRFSVASIVGSVAGLLVVAAVFVRVSLLSETSTSRVITYLFAEAVIRVPMLLFWTVAALIFNPREAKRLIGGIGAAGTAACIAAGAAIPRLVHDFGTENLLWIQAGLTTGFGILAVLAARHAPRTSSRAQPKKRTRLSYYFTLLRQQQVRSLAAMVGVATMCLVLTDFMFKTVVRAELQGTELAAFFGRFYAVANGGALLVQILLVHHILARGVGPALRILPAALLIASGGMAMFATFGWAVAAKFLEPLLEFTVNAAAVQMLYLAVQRQSRSQTRALVDGIVKPAAFAVAGALLVLTARMIAPQQVAYVIAAGALVWLILVQRNARLYMAGLLESIGMRRFDIGAERVEFTDPAVAKHVRDALRVSSDEDIPYLLALLPQWKGIDWTPEYRVLIERPSAEIKTLCLQYLAEHGGGEDVLHVQRELVHEDPDVRRAAVGAAMKIGGAQAPAWLVQILRNDPEPSVRAAAAAELINWGDLEDLILGATTFRSMLGSSQHSERAAAARSIVLVERQTLFSSLLLLLADPDPDVRMVALDAARSQREPALLPVVVALIRDRRVGWKAAQVIPAFGEPALERVKELSREARLDPPPRFTLHLPHLLALFGRPALPLLTELIDARNLDLRHALITAYCQVLGSEPPKNELPRVERLIWEELERARLAITTRDMTNGIPGNELLQLALSDEYEQHVDGLMRLLKVVVPDVEPSLMTASLTEGVERRAEALEILDNILPAKLKRRVLHLFEAVQQSGAGRDPLSELLTGSWSEWVSIGAIYCAGKARRTDLAPLVEPYLKDGSIVVRETAEEAIRSLGTQSQPFPDYDDITLRKRRSV
jgi:AAA family ATP:ADP antiporter